MQRLNDIVTTRRAELAKATERAKKAESAIEEKEPLLKERTKKLEDLQTKVELAKQRNQLNKELLVVLQKLRDVRQKLDIAEDLAKHGDTKVQSLHGEVESFESKYRTTKNLHEGLIREIENLGIN